MVCICVYSIYVIRRGLDRVATARRANLYKVCVQITYTRISVYKVYVYMCVLCNDPSAGSPTDALLRLLFPLDHTIHIYFH